MGCFGKCQEGWELRILYEKMVYGNDAVVLFIALEFVWLFDCIGVLHRGYGRLAQLLVVDSMILLVQSINSTA